MNLLITGALGHIGSKLIYSLDKIKNLKKVYLIDNAGSNNLNVLFNLKNDKIKIKFIYGDLLEKKTLKQIKSKIHTTIHLASITNAAQSFEIKKKIYSNNYGIFKNVVKFCIKKNSKLIHLSSTSIYGIESQLVDEKCNDLKPQSPYADIKLKEEIFLKKHSKVINFITLRFGTITGISKGMRFHTAVNKFCLKTILRERIPIWNNAIKQYRPYLSLKDAISTIIFIMNKNLYDNQIYNILTQNYTVNQILKMIKKKNYMIKIKKTRSPILNQYSYKVSNKKFKKFNLKFCNSIDDDIRQTLNLLKKLYN
tara:strand:+ start:10962 stop:11891 length:930 start_codon:yes stop_codon:yes gene_type:complete